MSQPARTSHPGAPLDPAASSPLVQEFRDLLQMEVERAGQSVTGLAAWANLPASAVRRAISGESLLPWEIYAEILTACGVPLSQQNRHRRRWFRARNHVAHKQSAPGRTVVQLEDSPRKRVYVELDDAELLANTPAEFAQLLRRIQARAGLTCGQIAAKTLIPRSQAYSMASKNRTTLPTKGDQVFKFVSACGLVPYQVERVLRLWSKLLEAKNTAPGLPEQTVPKLMPTTPPDAIGPTREWFQPARPVESKPPQAGRPPVEGNSPRATPSEVLGPVLDLVHDHARTGWHPTWRGMTTLLTAAAVTMAAVGIFLVAAVDRLGLAMSALTAISAAAICLLAFSMLRLRRNLTPAPAPPAKASTPPRRSTHTASQITVAELLARHNDPGQPQTEAQRRRPTPFIEELPDNVADPEQPTSPK